MTWAQRAKAGDDAKHFQEALKAKSSKVRETAEAIGRKKAEGLL
jgi:hypothetical protein